MASRPVIANPGDRICWRRRIWTVTEVLYAELLGTPVGPFYRCHRWTRRGGARVRVGRPVGAGGTEVVRRAR